MPDAALRFSPLAGMWPEKWQPSGDNIWAKFQGGKALIPIAVEVVAWDGKMAEVSGPGIKKKGMEVVVGEDGEIVNPIKSNVSTPPSASPPVTPAVNPAAELKALQGQWKVVRVKKGNDADLSWTVFPLYTLSGAPTFGPGIMPAIGDHLDFRNPSVMEIIVFSSTTDETFASVLTQLHHPRRLIFFIQ